MRASRAAASTGFGQFATSRPASSRVRPRGPPAQAGRHLHSQSRTRSSRKNAAAWPRAQRHLVNLWHGSAHWRTVGAHSAGPGGALPVEVRGLCGEVARARRTPGATGGAQRPHPVPKRRFSANFCASGPCWVRHRLTPAPPADLRCTSARSDEQRGVVGPGGTRRTSQSARRVQRYVIVCFTPRCLVDLAADGELVTNAPPDTVDLIMGDCAGDSGGAHAGPRGRRVDTRGA